MSKPTPRTSRPARAFLLLAALSVLGLLVPSPALRASGGSGTSGDPVLDPHANELPEQTPRDKKGKRARKKEAKKQKAAKEAIDFGARTALEWYNEALRRVNAGKYQDARAVLLPLEDSPRALDIQERVKLLLADAYFLNGGDLNYSEALARYRSFLTFYPGSDKAAYAQYQVGECYMRQLGRPDRDQSYTANAIAEFQRVQDAYGDSEYAPKAKAKQLEARARAARHEFQVVEFYYSWKNYSAALTRVSQMLMERPEATDREEALFIAADCCYRLGRAAEGDAYSARLKSDYPSSAYAAKLHGGDSANARAQVMKQDQHKQKELRRTYAAQRRREEHRTRTVRKDSGLDRRMPPQPVRTALEHAEAKPVAAGPVGLPVATAETAPLDDREKKQIEKDKAREDAAIHKKEKLAQQSGSEKKHQEKLEKEEQEQSAIDAEHEKKEADKKAEKEAAHQAKVASSQEKSTKSARKAEEKAAAEARDAAEADAKEKARQDKLEAEEQAAAAKKAELDAKAKEKADAEAKKRGAKEAEKARKDAEKARKEKGKSEPGKGKDKDADKSEGKTSD